MPGDLFGGGKPQNVQQTSTVQETPWFQPYMQKMVDKGPYPGQTFTPFAPATEAALGGIQQRALQGSPVVSEAQRHATNILQGDYLNANPYLDQAYQMGERSIMPGINATFGAGGRTGSEAHTQALGSGLADLSAQIYGGNYQQERQRQMQALGFAPTLAAQDYLDLSQLAGVGQAVEGKGMEALQDQMSRYYFPLDLISQIGTGGGRTSSTTQNTPYYEPSPLGNILGAGLSIAGMMGGNPLASLGGLFGGGGSAMSYLAPTLGGSGGFGANLLFG